MKAFALNRVDFHNLQEGTGALESKIMGIFIDTEKQTAASKISAFVSSIDDISLYFGKDKQVYPKYEVEEIEVF